MTKQVTASILCVGVILLTGFGLFAKNSDNYNSEYLPNENTQLRTAGKVMTLILRAL